MIGEDPDDEREHQEDDGRDEYRSGFVLQKTDEDEARDWEQQVKPFFDGETPGFGKKVGMTCCEILREDQVAPIEPDGIVKDDEAIDQKTNNEKKVIGYGAKPSADPEVEEVGCVEFCFADDAKKDPANQESAEHEENRDAINLYETYLLKVAWNSFGRRKKPWL